MAHQNSHGDLQPEPFRVEASSDKPQSPRWPPANLPGLLYGGDYNPEQWTPQMGYEGELVWLEDMRLMREAGVNVATVGVFSWASLSSPGRASRLSSGWTG